MAMRRFAVLPLAALLALTAAAPANAGANVTNTSGSGEMVYGEWFGEASYGYVFLAEESGYGGFGEIFQRTGDWVLCDPSGGPEGEVEPSDTEPVEGIQGFVGTVTWGYTYDVRIELSRRLERGSATGVVELYTQTIDECAGIYGGDPSVELATFDVSLTGEGDLVTFRGTGSYQIPSEFNGHSNYRGKERSASGSIVAGSSIEAAFAWAYMSQISWTEHTNG
jgi:hypothetical protein